MTIDSAVMGRRGRTARVCRIERVAVPAATRTSSARPDQRASCPPVRPPFDRTARIRIFGLLEARLLDEPLEVAGCNLEAVRHLAGSQIREIVGGAYCARLSWLGRSRP